MRPISVSRGRCFLPECDVIVEAGLAIETLCCLDNQQLVLWRSFQWEGYEWQRTRQKIEKASTQVMMSIISMTCFLVLETNSYPSHKAWGSVSWALMLPDRRSASSMNCPPVHLPALEQVTTGQKHLLFCGH